MKKMWFFSLLFISCMSENPLTPLLKTIEGEYEYMPLYEGMEMCYRYYSYSYRDYLPGIYYYFRVLFEKEEDGRKIFDIEMSVPAAGFSYLATWAVDDTSITEYDETLDEWVLLYEIPFILGNEWDVELHYERKYVDFKVHYEITGRKRVTVFKKEYDDCIEIEVNYMLKYTSYSHLYYQNFKIAEYYAPGVGLVRQKVLRFETNDPQYEGYDFTGDRWDLLPPEEERKESHPSLSIPFLLPFH